jgi:hypothetical protein
VIIYTPLADGHADAAWPSLFPAPLCPHVLRAWFSARPRSRACAAAPLAAMGGGD